jgi:hypothetical protein
MKGKETVTPESRRLTQEVGLEQSGMMPHGVF